MNLSAKQRAKLRSLGRTAAMLEQQSAAMRRAGEASRDFCKRAQDKIRKHHERAASYRQRGDGNLAQQEEIKAQDLQTQIDESKEEIENTKSLREMLTARLSAIRSVYNSIRERARLSHLELGVPYGNPELELAREAGAAGARPIEVG